MYADDKPLVRLLVNLGQVMAFKLADKKDISGFHRIQSAFNEKLPAAGYGVVDFVAVVRVDAHRVLRAEQMGDGKGLAFQAIVDSFFTGIVYIHLKSPLGLFNICNILNNM